MVTQLLFLPLFAHMHFAKLDLYVSVEVFKRIPFGVFVFARKNYFHSQYANYHAACIACYMIYIQWTIFKHNMLSSDIEANPGPETLYFCCSTLNSITAYDFLRICLIEACNSVYDNDPSGMVETSLHSTVDEDRLALDGYLFCKATHPQNVKIGGFALYIKDSLPCKHHLDLVTLPECIMSERLLNRKNYSYAVIYKSSSQDQDEFDQFTKNFELMIPKVHGEEPFCIIIAGDFYCRSTNWW